MKVTAIAACALVAAALVPVAASAGWDSIAGPADSHSSGPPRLEGRYIVVLRSADDVAAVEGEVRRGGGTVKHRYARVFRGLSATLPGAAVDALKRNPRVEAVVPDAISEAAATQTAPPWGLDRLDQRLTTGDGSYTYDTTGAGVTVFVMDTGMRFSHSQFAGRASSGYDFFDMDPDASDCHGHGTHVGGTAGGTTYGVAKEVRLVSLRIWGCDGSGPYSDMIAAIDWAIQNKPTGPSVMNISGGGGANDLVDQSVRAATDAGIPVVAAAHNHSDDACFISPARAPSALTVGATNNTDTRAGFSNYGPCVDTWAAGVGVLSATMDSDTSSRLADGTSMAAPHVTGAVARYLESRPTASSAQVTDAILAAATPGAVKNSLSPRSDLLYAAPGSTTASIAVTRAGSGTGTVTSAPAGISCGSTCTATFASGSSVTLTAAAAAGSSFTGWGGACSGATLTCTVAATTAHAVTATFAPSSVTVNDATVGTTSSTFSYAGTWNVSQGSLKFMGDDHWSTTTGSSYTFRFTGTQVKLYGAKAPHHGQASVSVDGGAATTINLYASTRQDNVVVFQSALLRNQAHTVKVTVKGTKSTSSTGYGVSVDRAVASTPTQVTVNDAVVGTAPDAFSYAGTWRIATGIATKYLGDDHWSNTTGSSYTFRFTGTQVALYGAKASSHGHASVQVDGGTPTTVDQYASTRQDNVLLYRSPVLSAGTHAVKVTVKGTRNASATGTTIAIDRAVASR